MSKNPVAGRSPGAIVVGERGGKLYVTENGTLKYGMPPVEGAPRSRADMLKSKAPGGGGLSSAQKDAVKEIQKVYPEVKSVPSVGRVKEVLQKVVPPIVLEHLVKSGSLKQCSSISPTTAEVMSKHGIPTFSIPDPSGRPHVVNVALTKDGPVKIDMSHIQFDKRLHDHDDPSEERAAFKKVREEVVRDPFSAIRVERMSHADVPAHLHPEPRANPSDKTAPSNRVANFDKAIERARKDPEGTKDIYGVDFSNFGDRANPGGALNGIGKNRR